MRLLSTHTAVSRNLTRFLPKTLPLMLSILMVSPTVMATAPVKTIDVSKKGQISSDDGKAKSAQFQQQYNNSRHEYTLDNGLKVIIKEDHRAPVVISQVWYRVGASDEPESLVGISHLLEHMMFQGTEKVALGEFDKIVSKFGGINNAFTSHHYTSYYEVFPANRLDLSLELEADRMNDLKLNEKQFSSERQVVMEERRQNTDDIPDELAYEAFDQMLFAQHPRRNSVIGTVKQIDAITLNDLKAWYQKWYAPNNATLVIVGDVNPENALAQAKKYFNDKPPRTLPERASVRQTGFRGYNHKTIKLPVQVPSLILGYNVPTLTTADNKKTAYSLQLLGDILDGGLSARLEKNLVRGKQILNSVSSGYSAFDRGDSALYIEATPKQGVSLQTAQKAILAEIEALKTQPITPAEIERAKTNAFTNIVYDQDSLSGQAESIGRLTSIGLDDRMVYQLPEILETINESDLQAVAKQYLTKDNLTSLHVVSDKK